MDKPDFLTKMHRLVFKDLQTFFEHFLSIFYKRLYAVINDYIYNKMIFQKKYILPWFSPWVGLKSMSKIDFERKFVKYLACTIYWTQRKNITNQNIFFWKNKKNLENFSLTFRSYFFILLLWDFKLFNFLKSVAFLK